MREYSRIPESGSLGLGGVWLFPFPLTLKQYWGIHRRKLAKGHRVSLWLPLFAHSMRDIMVPGPYLNRNTVVANFRRRHWSMKRVRQNQLKRRRGEGAR